MWKADKKFSLATFLTVLILIPLLIKFKCSSAGIFWCYKRDFEAIKGFNEDQRMLEDAEFAFRLRKWGKECGKKYGTITKAKMVVSSRKEEMFGEWNFFKHPKWILAYLKGDVEKYADEVFYDIRENFKEKS